jgi:hypothetical protein
MPSCRSWSTPLVANSALGDALKCQVAPRGGFGLRGSLAQTCDANSLSRSDSKFCSHA